MSSRGDEFAEVPEESYYPPNHFEETDWPGILVPIFTLVAGIGLGYWGHQIRMKPFHAELRDAKMQLEIKTDTLARVRSEVQCTQWIVRQAVAGEKLEVVTPMAQGSWCFKLEVR